MSQPFQSRQSPLESRMSLKCSSAYRRPNNELHLLCWNNFLAMVAMLQK